MTTRSGCAWGRRATCARRRSPRRATRLSSPISERVRSRRNDIYSAGPPDRLADRPGPAVHRIARPLILVVMTTRRKVLLAAVLGTIHHKPVQQFVHKEGYSFG